MWQTPKTDWIYGDKYNVEDINRVESNTEHLYEYLESIGYWLKPAVFKTNRTIESYDTVSSVNRWEQNIEGICERFIRPLGWFVIEWRHDTLFLYDDANRWERTIEMLYEYAQLTYEGYRYCGTFNAGTEGILP